MRPVYAALIIIGASMLIRIILTVSGKTKLLSQLLEQYDGSDEGLIHDMYIYYSRRYSSFARIIALICGIAAIWVKSALVVRIMACVFIGSAACTLTMLFRAARDTSLESYRSSINTELIVTILQDLASFAFILLAVIPQYR